MARTPRLLALIARLRDGHLHRGEDLARHLGVSVRTVYRDMDRLAASGVPVTGTRGAGYRIGDHLVLPPLSLSPAELDALTLGIAIVGETTDPDLKAAALSLADKLEAALPEDSIAEADAWKFAVTPLADSARGLSHVAGLRSAIRGKQKLRLTERTPTGPCTRIIRPLRLESWGRVWVLTAWSETDVGFCDTRLDLIDALSPLPELFVDEPGKRLSDR